MPRITQENVNIIFNSEKEKPFLRRTTKFRSLKEFIKQYGFDPREAYKNIPSLNGKRISKN